VFSEGDRCYVSRGVWKRPGVKLLVPETEESKAVASSKMTESKMESPRYIGIRLRNRISRVGNCQETCSKSLEACKNHLKEQGEPEISKHAMHQVSVNLVSVVEAYLKYFLNEDLALYPAFWNRRNHLNSSLSTV
jgi:hypothetical protein